MLGAVSSNCAILNNCRIQNPSLVVINRRMDACDCNPSSKRHSVSRRVKLGLRQFIAAYLAACLMLAGAVGLSPALHTLVEHGGRGNAHVHGRFDFDPAHSSSHRHADGEEHSHAPTEIPTGSGDGRSARIFVHSPDAFPGADVLVVRLWQRVQDWLAQQESPPASPDAGGEHHHDSLASSLAGGLIDQADPVVCCDSEPNSVTLRDSPSSDRVHAFDRENRFSPRGPPVTPG